MGQAHTAEQVMGPGGEIRSSSTRATCPGRGQGIFKHGELWQKVMILEDKSHLTVAEVGQTIRAECQWVDPVEMDGTRIGFVQCA